jgi:hypothetical protein
MPSFLPMPRPPPDGWSPTVKRRLRRRGAIGAGVVAVCALTAGAAFASGIVGSPQPEAKQFTIPGGSGGGATAAVQADGSLVIVYQDDRGNSGSGVTRVCHLLRDARACTSIATLATSSSEDPTPEIFTPAPGTVVVLLSTSPGALQYTSTNDGKTFGTGVQVGVLGVTAATLANGTLVYTQGDNHNGLQVQTTPAIGPIDSPGPTTVATGGYAVDVGLGTTRGGVLLGSDDAGTPDLTTVRFAPSGTDPSNAGSYSVVGTFHNEELLGISGDAVLTERGDAEDTVLLRLYTSHGFTAPTVVPGGKSGGPEWFAVDTDPAGRVHVFVETSRESHNVFQDVTSDGVHWSSGHVLGDAVASNGFGAAIDHSGSGILVGSGASGTASVFPILNGQDVKIALKKATITVHAHTTLSGKAGPILPGQVVRLEDEKGHKWYVLTSTHEKTNGTFAFVVAGTSIGTTTYRAVIVDRPGYDLYGYSNTVVLTRRP